ncbi:MAG: hypothetical protein C4291_10120 [Candidatus Dadabacteria bacterium]
MNELNIFLILLSAGTIAIVVVALKTPFFIADKGERAYQAIHFLLGIIAGYVFPSFLGGIVLGILKELVGITLAAYRGLLGPERMLRTIRSLIFWILGGFFGVHTLERFHYSVLFLLGT